MRYLLFILFAIQFTPLFSQNYNFRTFYLEQGLSQSQVFDICQDKIGRMWFTTFGGGITIYDGKNTEYLTTKDGLPSNIVHCLYVDSDDNIWIGTDNGAAYFDGEKIVRIEKTIGNQLEFWNICEDQFGDIWLGSLQGIFVYNDSTVQSISHEINSLPSFIHYNDVFLISGFAKGLALYNGNEISTNFINELDQYSVNKLYIDNFKNLWITTSEGVFKYRDGKLTDETGLLPVDDLNVLTIIQDEFNRYWIGTNAEGLFVLEKDEVIQITEDQGILFNKVEKIFEDNMNNVWIGTDGGGVSVFRGFAFTNYTFERLLPNDFIWSVLVDHSGSKWFGTDGNGLIKLENDTYTIYNSQNSQLSNDHINAIFEDSKKRIWLGTNKGMTILEQNKFVSLQHPFLTHIVAINEDVAGNMWFGTYGDGVVKYDGENFSLFKTEDGLGDNYVWTIFPNADGTIMFGTEEGLTILENGKFRNYDTSDGLSDPSIWSIRKGHYGNYWLITDNSLVCYNKEKFINHYTSELLDANVLYVIDTFNINHLILGTEKGLNKVTYTKNGEITSTKHYGRSEGFLGIECNANAISHDKEGVFWFGTVNGVSTFNPLEEKANIYPPIVYLRNIKLFYEDVDWTNYTDSVYSWTKQPHNLVLDYRENNLTFEYVGMNYRNPEKVQYQYVLEGNDADWHPVTQKNEATYTNIPPGDYTFKVMASNEDGLWSKPFEFSFTIDHPFWQSAWFVFAMAILILLLIYIALYLRTYQLQKLRIILSNKVKIRTAELNEQKEELQSALSLIREQKEELESTLIINQKQKEELERANVEIQKSAKLKEVFLANTSHEIRTPLNVINGYTNLLLNTPLKDKQLDYLRNIKTSSNNLLIIVNDILDFSKIEAGKLKIEKIEFNLHNLIRDFYGGIAVKANEKKLNLKYSIQNTVPQYVKGDPFRLNQILLNLVRNAIKFTNEGGTIKLIVQLYDDYDEITKILFIIEDTGIGIQKAKLKTIFDSFTQASTETTRKYGGTGLGLSIVKNLVDLQQGTVEVESEKGKGSKFSVLLPFQKSTGKEIKQKENNYVIETPQKLMKLSILLVEDNPLNVTLAIDTILMYNNKIKIDVAVNGKQAIEKLESGSYDIVIMDIQMPEMDGYDATRYIRNEMSEPEKSIPILGMSAHAMKEEKERCFDIGMNEYLTKPFVPEELFAKIELLTGRKTMQKQADTDEGENKTDHNLKHINLENLYKIYKHDDTKLTHILQSYLEHMPDMLGKLKKALQNEDKKAMKVAAHSLKTSLKFVGATKSADLAKYIELNAQNHELKQIIIDNFEVLENDFNCVVEEINVMLNALNEAH